MIEKILVQTITDERRDDDTVLRVKKPEGVKQSDIRLSFFCEENNYHIGLPWDSNAYQLSNALRHLADVIVEDLKEKGNST